jgi:hypothetical protein
MAWLALLNPLNAELNPICHLLALLGAHPILHVSRIRVKVWAGLVSLELVLPSLSNVGIIYYLYQQMHTHVLEYIIILQMLVHVSVLMHHLQGALILCLLKL